MEMQFNFPEVSVYVLNKACSAFLNPGGCAAVASGREGDYAE